MASPRRHRAGTPRPRHGLVHVDSSCYGHALLFRVKNLLGVRSQLQPKPRISERRPDRLAVPLGDALAAGGLVPGAGDALLHLGHDCFGLVTCQVETCALREQVLGMGVPAHVAGVHGKVPSFEADRC